ncbi:MAG: beta-ketoacyl-ACP synthase II [Planctomycetaceae bacterium]|nr:beta-ketoacyl-ACP synthase II [Planctomycetaceae bacterium]
MTRRVVVTGTSVVTSLGCEVAEFWDRICAGKSGVGPVRRFDCSEFKVRFGGELRDFDAADHMDINPKEMRRLDRFVQFALVGAHKAIAESGIDFTQGDPYRYGVLVGSGIGGLNEIEAQHEVLYGVGPSRVSPFMIPKLMINAASGNISVNWQLKGPNSTVATACASSTNAIGDAFRLIQHGVADVMVTGGSECALTPMGLSGFARMKALSTRNDDPEIASRPWDKDRDGFVMSEGAGIILLEEYEFAKARGANILAELVGYGMSADASHITAPDPEGSGAAVAMKYAIEDAGIPPDQIGYINAHGTSTPLGDVAETKAIKSVFGEHAKKLLVSSTKGHTGHLIGASGGVEFVVCVQALKEQIAPPTINLDHPDEDCDLDYVPHEPRSAPLQYAMKNSFGFGGHNACLVLKKAD